MMDFADFGRFDGLRLARRPADDGALDLRVPAEPEVEWALVLRAEAAAAGNDLHLLLAVPVEAHFSADGAAVALGAFEVEADASGL